MKHTVEPERIKISTAAKLLSITPLTIRRGIGAGRIPYIKNETGHIFIPMSWIHDQSKAQYMKKEVKHD
jgi:hypothetical protein